MKSLPANRLSQSVIIKDGGNGDKECLGDSIKVFQENGFLSSDYNYFLIGIFFFRVWEGV